MRAPRPWLRRPLLLLAGGPVAVILVAGGPVAVILLGGCPGVVTTSDGGRDGSTILWPDGTPLSCPGGVDQDGDGRGEACPLGSDCNDADRTVHSGAPETCDGKDNDCNGQIDEGVRNACGTCDPGCSQVGEQPFPVNPNQDPQLKDVNGVGLDPNGDLVLDRSKVNFNYMWIANCRDTLGAAGGCAQGAGDPQYNQYNPALDPYCRGTVSKIDTVNLKEVGRYFTIVCSAKGGATGCLDRNGMPLRPVFPQDPSRTAVDYNFDVWVANRAFGGQPSATKIANAPSDCVERNGIPGTQTSRDQNGDGRITVDCDGDKLPDSASTVCKDAAGVPTGVPPEFYGDDDECVLFTAAYGDPGVPQDLTKSPADYGVYGDMGRSVCLDAGSGTGASNAWVGTYGHYDTATSPPTWRNRFFKIDGQTGKVAGPYDLPANHGVYGCVVDSQKILWSVDSGGTLAFLDTANPSQVGPLLTPPMKDWFPPAPGCDVPNPPPECPAPRTAYFYGVAIDSADRVWAGGWLSGLVYRYAPDRSKFGTLHQGSWAGVAYPQTMNGVPVKHSRGIATDQRGKVWVAINEGFIWRTDQNVGSGFTDQSGSASYWPATGITIIGVGVDFAGHVWGISYSDNKASRLDVDSLGDPVQPATTGTKVVPVGMNPYTYSDFTGYGLQSFTRPQGRYLYQLQPCSKEKKTVWQQVIWKATEPPGTSVTVRVRSGESEATLGAWFGPYDHSPALLGSGAPSPLSPNPAPVLQVEFTLQTTLKDATPVLHDFDVTYGCVET